MTNNPTIDGVSRELIKGLMHFAPNILANELRALLDREVITDDHLRKRIAFLTSEIHAQSDVRADLQSTIAQLEDKLNKAIDLDFRRRETIEQLQARITQLESEAMYAAAGYQAARDRIAELESGRNHV